MYCPYGFDCGAQVCFLDRINSRDAETQPCAAKGWKIKTAKVAYNSSNVERIVKCLFKSAGAEEIKAEKRIIYKVSGWFKIKSSPIFGELFCLA